VATHGRISPLALPFGANLVKFAYGATADRLSIESNHQERAIGSFQFLRGRANRLIEVKTTGEP
jgi:hypothetical protein